MRGATIAALLALLSQAALAELGSRHDLRIELDWTALDADSTLGAWPDGGFGKLRYAAKDTDATRLALEYSGRIAPQLFAHAVLDAIEDAEQHVGLTEAYLEWRPLPSGANRHRYRFGAFYPAFSLENAGFAWESPYSRSFSAINAWLGEEIRPVGADWRLSRSLGGPGSPHELEASAGVFYGNDPAATLLFWRGWSVHDRQTRLNERLPLPPLILPDPNAGADRVITRRLDPIAEIDDRPGVVTSLGWSYAKRARVSLGFYDNRADPYAFRNGQWAWATRFRHIGAQLELPARFGLVAQFMQGDTDWLVNVRADGQMTPETELYTDDFEASFVLLSRPIGERHRLSLRRDDFSLVRPGMLVVDDGSATTLAYRYAVNRNLSLELEWLQIDSRRDLWPYFYGQDRTGFDENLIQLGFRYVLFDSTD